MTEKIAAQKVGMQQPQKRIPAVAEALGYIGGALALTALVVLVSMYWSELGVWGRSGIAAAVAVAGLIGGFALERSEAPAAQRLSQFLLVLGVAGIGCAVGFVVDYFTLIPLDRKLRFVDAQQRSSEWAWFAGMLCVAASGGLVWWRRRTWLQHLAFGLGVGLSALLVLPLVPIEGPDWGPGLVLAFVGVVWGALALRGALEPENAGLLLACLGILGGIELSAISGETADGGGLLAWAVWLGIAVALALVVGGVALKRLVVTAAAVVGVALFAFQMISEVLDIGMGTPIAFLGAGIALLAGAAWWLPGPGAAEKRALSIAAEVAGYVGVAFAAAGGGMLVGEYWDDLTTPVRIAVPAVLAVIAYGAAWLIERGKTDSTRRLAHTLHAAGAGAVGATVAMIVFPIAEELLPANPVEGPRYIAAVHPESWAGFSAALGVVVAGAVTWWRRSGAMVAVVTGGGLFALTMTGSELLGFQVGESSVAGFTLLGIGLVWVVLGALERLLPANTVIGVGCALSIMGTQMLLRGGPEGPRWPIWLGIALSVAAISASIPLKRGVMLTFGALGVVFFATGAVQEFFQGQIGAPIMLLIIGIVFIAMAVLVAVVLPRLRKAPAGTEQ